MPPKFNGFTVEEPSSTRVDMPMPIVDNQRRHGLISEYNPNLIDKIGNLVPDTGIGGVLKGLYSGTDRNLFGLLPSGNYETVSPESDLGEDISFLADPIAGAKGLRGLKHTVSGGTPVSRLIANSINPTNYNNKWGEVKRVLSNKKLFKEAVIDDIPQYKIANPQGLSGEDRLYAWRTKLGLGKPNPKYNQNVNIDKLWNKFGTHTENGKTYHHYKKFKDFKAGVVTDDMYGWGQIPSGRNEHALFGGYRLKEKNKYNLFKPTKIDYYDNWDFAFNRAPLDIIKEKGLSTAVQRTIAESLLKPLEFKGTFKIPLRRSPSFRKPPPF